MAELNEKQKRFADEYLIDLNATQAAIRAGYSPKTACEQGARLLANAKIRAYIDERMAEHSKRTGINQERIIRELAKIALLNASDVVNLEDATVREGLSRDDTAAISSVKVKITPTPEGNVIEREIKFYDKLKALELLGKRFAMWTERHQVEGNVGVQIIDDIGSESGEDENDGDDDETD